MKVDEGVIKILTNKKKDPTFFEINIILVHRTEKRILSR